MIKFHSISGFVTIDDRKGATNPNPRAGACINPEVGMTMPTTGTDIIVVTGDDGIVELEVNNHYVLLEERSYLHIRADGRSYHKKHNENLAGPNKARLVLGHIWAKIMSMAGKEDGKEIYEGNAAVGVRG